VRAKKTLRGFLCDIIRVSHNTVLYISISNLSHWARRLTEETVCLYYITRYYCVTLRDIWQDERDTLII
jgi:hypothetical protein